jgi:phosphate transport system substrate-binding protein
MKPNTRVARIVSMMALGSAMAIGLSAVASAASIKLPKSGVETPPPGTVTETGSTLLFPLWNLWSLGYSTQFPQVRIQTGGTGSGAGISQASNGTVNVGASDAYLSPSVVQAHPTLRNIPLAISSQLVTYNVPGITTHLKLSGKEISSIYQGKVKNWNDASIQSVNSGVHLPNLPIVTLHRSESSGDTFLFTQFLAKSDPNGWGSAIGFNTTVPWPNAAGALGEMGNSGMVTGCRATPGCIAYVGISYVTQLQQGGLSYAALQNAKGNYELPTATTIAAEAAAFVKKTPASGTISMIYGPASTGYPIINYEYAIVDSHQPGSSTAKAIRSILEWAINPKNGSGSAYLSKVHFQPLPSSVSQQSLKQILKIQ